MQGAMKLPSWCTDILHINRSQHKNRHQFHFDLNWDKTKLKEIVYVADDTHVVGLLASWWSPLPVYGSKRQSKIQIRMNEA